MNYLSTLPEEVMHLVSSHLTPREIHIFFLMTSKDMKQTFAESYQTWRQVLGTASHDIIMPLLCEYGHDKKLLEDYNNPSSSSYAKMARAIAGMEDLSMGHWRQARYGSAEDLFSEQEAHSSVLLTSPCKQKKYLAVIPGWGKAKKQAEIFDVTQLPDIRRVKSEISGTAGYFKYGHSSTKINDDLIMIFGGLTCGGYRGAINLLTIGEVHPYYNAEDMLSEVSALNNNNEKEDNACSSGAKRSREVSFNPDDDGEEEEEKELMRADRILKGKFTSSNDPMDDPIKPLKPGPWSSVVVLDENVSSNSNSKTASSSSSTDNVPAEGNTVVFENIILEHKKSNENNEDFDDLNDQFSHMSASYDIDNEEVEESDDDADDDDTDNTGDVNNDTSSHLPEVEIKFRVVQYSVSPFYAQRDPGGGAVPTPRGYHTATVVDIYQEPFLLVWGGLGNRLEDDPANALDEFEPYENDVGQVLFRGTTPITQLELMNCGTMKWHTDVEATGTEPSSRYGHSCTYHPRTNSVIVMGGADSNDLIRKGEELREVYLLTIVPPLDPPSIHRKQSRNAIDDATTFTNVAFVWSQLRVDCGDAVGLQVPGRCHSASLVSRDKLLVFGGSAFGTTNAVIVMDFKALNTCELKEKATAKDGIQHLRSTLISSTSCRDDDRELKRDAKHCPDHSWTILMHAPIIIGEPPLERLSALCAQVGKYFLIQGGYDTADRDCLNDCQVLDICCSTAQ